MVVKGLAVACAGRQRLSGKAIPVTSSVLAPNHLLLGPETAADEDQAAGFASTNLLRDIEQMSPIC